ncbi:hypothetical protein GS399_01995 [Pedobacter sp. HMF7647]|uniref:Lipocalin-like domain-containing protein n=1 Tax=Hufsiella arboris TaxID=2695275 RepID=A0A7K1Y561_9SPHI|nr:lipocalin family protein [Hufsiella arboris]MXV49726.1 hypothetical protein [Hufsiella arboris]
MKKSQFSLIALLGLFAIVSSCKKDDSSPDDKRKLLIGVWHGVTLQYKVYENGNLDNSASGTEDLSDETIELKENGSYISRYETGTWTLSGDKITVDNGTPDEHTATITKLTSSDLVLYESDEATVSGVKYKYEDIQTYKR